MAFNDEWLVATVQVLLPEGAIDAVRTETGTATVSLWEQLVQRRLTTDEQILAAIAKRFRLPVAEIGVPRRQGRGRSCPKTWCGASTCCRSG